MQHILHDDGDGNQEKDCDDPCMGNPAFGH